MQRGREYGLRNYVLNSCQTTKLHTLQPKALKSMQTNNKCEYMSGRFSHLADISKFRNRNSSAEMKGHKGQHSSSSSKSINYIINNKNCSKITQLERKSMDFNTKEKAKRMN